MIAIIDYNAGNIRSVENALHRLGYPCIVTQSVNEITAAKKVIFPGVGEAGSAMHSLKEMQLDDVIINLRQPVLGICLGMQLMCRHSEEGDTQCLGIFDTSVKRFPPDALVPQTGWNNFTHTSGSLFREVDPSADMYYVHSYYAETGPDTIAICDYILPFSAAMQKENFYGTQFHPEKSATSGERILKNFLAL